MIEHELGKLKKKKKSSLNFLSCSDAAVWLRSLLCDKLKLVQKGHMPSACEKVAGHGDCTALLGTPGAGAWAAGSGLGATLAGARRAPYLHRHQIHSDGFFSSVVILLKQKQTTKHAVLPPPPPKKKTPPQQPQKKKFFPHKPQIRKEQKGTSGAQGKKRCGISALRKATRFPRVLWKLLGHFAYSATTIFLSLSRFSLANTPGEGPMGGEGGKNKKQTLKSYL